MDILIVLISLLIIGILAHYCGQLAEYLKLPSLIGMMVLGMVIGPAFLNLVPKTTLTIAPTLKDIALVTVLFIGGLGISLTQMKQIGRPAVLLSAVPATLEGFTIAFMAMLLLNFSFIQGAILGFIIAAVSPAVLIPSMIDLINRRVGQDKAIPQMLLVGSSADDTVARFALLFQAQGDSNNRRFCFYDCTATRPSGEHTTKEDSISPNTETISIRMNPRSTDKMVKCHIDETAENKAVYDAWFSAVPEKSSSIRIV